MAPDNQRATAYLDASIRSASSLMDVLPRRAESQAAHGFVGEVGEGFRLGLTERAEREGHVDTR